MKSKDYLDIFSTEGVRNANEERKMKKFFRWAIPILILEIIVVIGIAVFFFLMPNNHCVISINSKDAVVYINNEKTKDVRLDSPKESENNTNCYYYEINLQIKLPADGQYKVSYVVTCDKYKVRIAPENAVQQGDAYVLTVMGGEKAEVLEGFTIISKELIRDFKVEIKINVEKVV